MHGVHLIEISLSKGFNVVRIVVGLVLTAEFDSQSNDMYFTGMYCSILIACLALAIGTTSKEWQNARALSPGFTLQWRYEVDAIEMEVSLSVHNVTCDPCRLWALSDVQPSVENTEFKSSLVSREVGINKNERKHP